MTARRFIGRLSRLLAFGLLALTPLMIGSFMLGPRVKDYGFWIPSAGIAILMFVTGVLAPVVARTLVKKYRLTDLQFAWVTGFLVGGLFWARDYAPRSSHIGVTSTDVLTAVAVILATTTCLVIGSWVGVLWLGGGKETWREWMRRLSSNDWSEADDQ